MKQLPFQCVLVAINISFVIIIDVLTEEEIVLLLQDLSSPWR